MGVCLCSIAVYWVYGTMTPETKLCLKNVTTLILNNYYTLEPILIILAHHMTKILAYKCM